MLRTKTIQFKVCMNMILLFQETLVQDESANHYFLFKEFPPNPYTQTFNKPYLPPISGQQTTHLVLSNDYLCFCTPSKSLLHYGHQFYIIMSSAMLNPSQVTAFKTYRKPESQNLLSILTFRNVTKTSTRLLISLTR